MKTIAEMKQVASELERLIPLASTQDARDALTVAVDRVWGAIAAEEEKAGAR